MKKKILTCLLVSILVVGVLPIGASAEWKQDNKGWWYSEGNSYSTGWTKIDGNWYYFDNKGYMESGQYIGNYYLNSNGVWTDLGNSATNSKYNEFVNRLSGIEKNDSIESQKAATTYDIVMYSKNFNQQYDDLLNDIYNYLKTTMSSQAFNKLQSEETNWINKKEAAMESSADEAKGGSMSAYISSMTSLSYTHDRIYELLKYVNK